MDLDTDCKGRIMSLVSEPQTIRGQDRPPLSKTLKTNHQRAGKIRPHTALGQGQGAVERGTLTAAPQ